MKLIEKSHIVYSWEIIISLCRNKIERRRYKIKELVIVQGIHFSVVSFCTYMCELC